MNNQMTNPDKGADDSASLESTGATRRAVRMIPFLIDCANKIERQLEDLEDGSPWSAVSDHLIDHLFRRMSEMVGGVTILAPFLAEAPDFVTEVADLVKRADRLSRWFRDIYAQSHSRKLVSSCMKSAKEI